MNTRKVSLFIAACLWLAVGFRIACRGLDWLEPYFQTPDWHLGLLLISVIVGLAKAFFVLRKVVNRRIDRIGDIDDSPINYLIGWVKLLGLHGVIAISLMIGIGYGLRYLHYHGADPYNLFGFFYLGIAFALGGSSLFFFFAAKNHQDQDKVEIA